jgi:hypothetical protein
MVFFKNKTGSPYSITQPDQFLSQRAIDRRIRQGIAVFEEDIPVNPAYVQGMVMPALTYILKPGG